MARRRPGRLLTVLGALVILVGFVGAVILALAATQRQANAVDGLARAPVGCDTTLDFAEAGEYLVFVERSGSIDEVRGDCDVDEEYAVTGRIDVVITVVDPDGVDVELGSVDDAIDYDVDGFVATAAFTLDIAEPGDHVMRVESSDGQFVVAVGADPSDGLVALFAAALAAAVVGLVVGIGMILAGRSRAKRSVAPATVPPPYQTPFSPVGQVPQGPPTYTQPGGPVQYQPPPSGPSAPPPVYGQPPAAPVAPPAPPTGVPAYQPAPPQAPPAPPTPQIPGEPTWVAPGQHRPPPAPIPVPPDVTPRTDPWSESPQPAVPDPASIPPTSIPADDATVQRRDVSDSDEGVGSADDSPTIERPSWGDPPPPS